VNEFQTATTAANDPANYERRSAGLAVQVTVRRSSGSGVPRQDGPHRCRGGGPGGARDRNGTFEPQITVVLSGVIAMGPLSPLIVLPGVLVAMLIGVRPEELVA
jgi:hypothetical protein